MLQPMQQMINQLYFRNINPVITWLLNTNLINYAGLMNEKNISWQRYNLKICDLSLKKLN